MTQNKKVTRVRNDWHYWAVPIPWKVLGVGTVSATNGFMAPCRATAMATPATQVQLAPRLRVLFDLGLGLFPNLNLVARFSWYINHSRGILFNQR